MTVLQDDRAALALQALAEVTDPASVGELVEVVEGESGLRDLVFACRLPGYIGWRWTVSTARVADVEPTVLEVELLPGEGALVAPPWVPWAERLAEYRRTHPDAEPDGLELDLDEDDTDDDDELDELDAGDALEIDGVEFEDAAEDESDDDSDDDDDDDDDDGDDGDDDTDAGGRSVEVDADPHGARDDAPGDEDAAWHDEGSTRS